MPMPAPDLDRLADAAHRAGTAWAELVISERWHLDRLAAGVDRESSVAMAVKRRVQARRAFAAFAHAIFGLVGGGGAAELRPIIADVERQISSATTQGQSPCS